MTLEPWYVSGSYFESCNCDPICPCRQIGGQSGGLSSHGVCFGSLSWLIQEGRAGEVDLAGLSVVLSLWFTDDIEPSTPWQVVLYIDERAGPEQRDLLADIFLGHAGGTPVRNFATAIGSVIAVRSARIELDHAPRRQSMRVGGYLTVRAARPFQSDVQVRCGIPGFDRPGEELVTEVLKSDDEAPLNWDLHGTCGFASDFDYRSESA